VFAGESRLPDRPAIEVKWNTSLLYRRRAGACAMLIGAIFNRAAAAKGSDQAAAREQMATAPSVVPRLAHWGRGRNWSTAAIRSAAAIRRDAPRGARAEPFAFDCGARRDDGARWPRADRAVEVPNHDVEASLQRLCMPAAMRGHARPVPSLFRSRALLESVRPNGRVDANCVIPMAIIATIAAATLLRTIFRAILADAPRRSACP